MGSYSWLFLVDPSTFIMLECAVLTILYGCYQSLSSYSLTKDLDAESGDVKLRTAIILPIVGSVFLVALFFFLDKLYYLLLVILAFSSCTGFSMVVYPYIDTLLNRFNLQKEWKVRWVEVVSLSGVLALLAGIVVVVFWIIFRAHPSAFFLSDILAISLAITSISSVRLPNLKVSSVILTLFFLYDIFWVFISPLIFKKSVMVQVATGLPDLPMVITFPRFLDDGSSLLGLGDIILPGLFLSFLYRFDHFNNIGFMQGYFLRSWIGYIVGLVMTLIMVYALNMGQPALLYLVPCTLLTAVFFGWRRGQLHDLWHGLYTLPDSENGIPLASTEGAANEDEKALLSDVEVVGPTLGNPPIVQLSVE